MWSNTIIRAALKDKSEEEIAEYIKVHKLEKVTVEDIKNADVGNFDPSDFKIFEEQIAQSKPVVTEAPKEEPKVEEKTEEVTEEKTEVIESEEKEESTETETAEEPVEAEASEEVKTEEAEEVARFT